MDHPPKASNGLGEYNAKPQHLSHSYRTPLACGLHVAPRREGCLLGPPCTGQQIRLCAGAHGLKCSGQKGLGPEKGGTCPDLGCTAIGQQCLCVPYKFCEFAGLPFLRHSPTDKYSPLF